MSAEVGHRCLCIVEDGVAPSEGQAIDWASQWDAPWQATARLPAQGSIVVAAPRVGKAIWSQHDSVHASTGDQTHWNLLCKRFWNRLALWAIVVEKLDFTCPFHFHYVIFAECETWNKAELLGRVPYELLKFKRRGTSTYQADHIHRFHKPRFG